MLNRSAGIFIFLLTACVRSIQSTPAEPVPPAVEDPPATPGVMPARSWAILPTSAIKRYVSTGITLLELQSDTSATTASLTTATSFTLSVFQDTEFTRIHGSLDSFSAQANSRISQADPLPVMPLVFRGRLINGGFHLDSINGQSSRAGDCRNSGLNNLATIRQSLIAVPDVLTPGLTWVDSSTVSACSGFIPLQLTTVKTYTVAGESSRNGSPVIVISRIDRFTASGEGAQGQHRVTVLTRGTGSAKIRVDRTSGLLNDADVELQARVTITASGRTQVFTQMARDRITLVD